MKKLSLLFLLFINLYSSAQIQFDRIEPPSWWIGMHDKSVQLLVHGKDISKCDVSIKYANVKVFGIHRVENPNYLFIDLLIEDKARPGKIPINFILQKKIVKSTDFILKARADGSSLRSGFTSSDVIYLIMPDRFSNGNPGNDSMPGMLEKPGRSNPNGRHGGDLEGISNHLDYIQSLGATAIWLNPVQENNMPKSSYHGYAITDFYKIDPRLGTENDYLDFVSACHKRNLKVIMDMVFNHCGTYHWWMQDLPTNDWIHEFPVFTRSNFRSEVLSDPYGSEYDRIKMLSGWFDKSMPDLNQHQDFLANYLIQNSIWWIENAGLDGIRMDTYPYSYPDFMTRWMERITLEYPYFSVVGETWLQNESTTAYWQKDALNRNHFNSQLPYVTDFLMQFALRDAFNQTQDWTSGIARLYYVLTQDFLYSDPEKLVIFADNHDLTRYFTSVGEDLNKWKMGMAFLLTTRGVPVIYYGTEILMTGDAGTGHGHIREDFPGGWLEDSINAFNELGRSPKQSEAFNYIQKLLQWRDQKEVIHSGKLKHFVPQDEVYSFFRYNDKDCVMVILNNSDQDKTVDMGRFNESTNSYMTGTEVMTGKVFDIKSPLKISPKSALILELGR